MSKFVIQEVPTGYKFYLTAPNGQSIAASEVYKTAAACRKGIESVRKNAPKAATTDLTTPDCKAASNPRFELYQDKSGAFRFRLKSRNGQIIAVSQDYTTKSACENGIESIRKNAPDAKAEEA